MRKLLIYKKPDYYAVLTYNHDKDGSSEEAMRTLDKILYDLKPDEFLTIFCVR